MTRRYSHRKPPPGAGQLVRRGQLPGTLGLPAFGSQFALPMLHYQAHGANAVRKGHFRTASHQYRSSPKARGDQKAG
jgi:hypothetical protein